MEIHELRTAVVEARKRLEVAMDTAQKEHTETERALSKADAAMKTALDLKDKAEKAKASLDLACKHVTECRREENDLRMRLESAALAPSVVQVTWRRV